MHGLPIEIFIHLNTKVVWIQQDTILGQWKIFSVPMMKRSRMTHTDALGLKLFQRVWDINAIASLTGALVSTIGTLMLEWSTDDKLSSLFLLRDIWIDTHKSCTWPCSICFTAFSFALCFAWETFLFSCHCFFLWSTLRGFGMESSHVKCHILVNVGLKR